MNHASTSQLKTIITLFVVLRLTILLMYTPQGLLNAYVDYQHYYRVAQLAEQGRYLFVNAWSEHLPLMAYTSQLAYVVTRAVLPPGGLDSFTYQVFARLLGGLMLVFETGSLILLHRLARRAWDMDRADWLGWVYGTLSVPLFFWNASQTSNVLFFTLLAAEWFLIGRRSRSAVALALGIMTKFIPVFLLGAVARWLWPRRGSIARYSFIVLIVIALIFAPFVVAGGGPWIAASLASNLGRASYATLWAVIDGNGGVGEVGDVPARTRLEQAATIYGNPPVIPGILILIAFGALYLWLFRRPIDPHSPRHFLWFCTLMLMLFFLWSKGWSPQWATLAIPFMLLAFPDRRGLWLVLTLTALVCLEWPLADALRSPALLLIAITGRTILFITTGVLIARSIWVAPGAEPRPAAFAFDDDYIP